MKHDPALRRDQVLDRIEALEQEYVDGDHTVAGELTELYDADGTPKASRIWNALAAEAKAQPRTKETNVSKSTATKPKKTGIADPKKTVRAYLASELSATEVGTVEMPAPYITKTGRLHVHSRHMTVWAKRELGKEIEQADVQAALRELHLTVRAVAMPGLGKSVGYYVGRPKGVSLRGLPVRDLNGKAKA